MEVLCDNIAEMIRSEKMEIEQEYIRNVIDNLLSKKTPGEKEEFYKYLEKVYLEGKKLYKHSEYLTNSH